MLIIKILPGAQIGVFKVGDVVRFKRTKDVMNRTRGIRTNSTFIVDSVDGYSIYLRGFAGLFGRKGLAAAWMLKGVN